jgi:ABC-type amino acid transport substrate-binding protein
LVIAASGSTELAKLILEAMLTDRPDLASRYQLLSVPKDIDALMAVTFGMADAALSNELSLTTLTDLYPEQGNTLRVLAKSQPLLHMQVVAPRQLGSTEHALLEAIRQMKRTDQGRRSLSMLGLEDWAAMDLAALPGAAVNGARSKGVQP